MTQDSFAKVALDGGVANNFNYSLVTIGNYSDPFVSGMELYDENMLLVYGGFSQLEGNQVYSIAKLNLLAPFASSNLVAEFDFENGVSLNWSNNSDIVNGVEVFRSVDGINFGSITTTGADANSFKDQSVELGQSYIYKIRVVNDIYFSDFSDGSEVITRPLDAVTELSSSFDFSKGISLSWNDNSSFEEVIELYKSEDNISFELLASLSPNITTHQDFDATLNEDYFYKIRIKAGLFESAYSETATQVIPLTASLTTPFNLLVERMASQLNLSWSDNNSKINGYEIHRSVGESGKYELLKSVTELSASDEIGKSSIK